jgi:hypothetical protein
MVPSVAASECSDILVLETTVKSGAFVVHVQYSTPLDELTSMSDAYREAQLEAVALAGQCFVQYAALKQSEKVQYLCNTEITAGSVSIKNYSLQSEILCQDRQSLRIASVVSFQLK